MKIRKELIKKKIRDKYLVVATGKLAKEFKFFIELNETGSQVWDMVEMGLTKQEIAQNISKQYEIDISIATNDVNEIIDKMISCGVIVD